MRRRRAARWRECRAVRSYGMSISYYENAAHEAHCQQTMSNAPNIVSLNPRNLQAPRRGHFFSRGCTDGIGPVLGCRPRQRWVGGGSRWRGAHGAYAGWHHHSHPADSCWRNRHSASESDAVPPDSENVCPHCNSTSGGGRERYRYRRFCSGRSRQNTRGVGGSTLYRVLLPRR
jgi:hypothetical protein